MHFLTLQGMQLNFPMWQLGVYTDRHLGVGTGTEGKSRVRGCVETSCEHPSNVLGWLGCWVVYGLAASKPGE